MKIEKKPIKELFTPDYNPRIGVDESPEFHKKLKQSIEKFGYIEPIVWNKRTGNVVGGNQRLAILQEMGVKEVEVVEVDIPKKEEKALNLALNKVVGDWSQQKLATLLRELKDTAPSMLDITGFSEMEVENILSSLPEFDPVKEWKGMPEFHMQDMLGRSITVHFESETAVQEFAKLIGQSITEKTRFIWFPPKKEESFLEQRYKSEVEDE